MTQEHERTPEEVQALIHVRWKELLDRIAISITSALNAEAADPFIAGRQLAETQTDLFWVQTLLDSDLPRETVLRIWEGKEATKRQSKEAHEESKQQRDQEQS